MLKPVTVKDLDPMITQIDKEWMLITAGDQQSRNTMTASWGTFGTLWNKPVSIIFVRPQRYTYQFCENNDYYSLLMGFVSVDVFRKRGSCRYIGK